MRILTCLEVGKRIQKQIKETERKIWRKIGIGGSLGYVKGLVHISAAGEWPAVKQSWEEPRPEASPMTSGILREGNRDQDSPCGRCGFAPAPSLEKAFLRLNLFSIITTPHGAFLDIFSPSLTLPSWIYNTIDILIAFLYIVLCLCFIHKKWKIFFTPKKKLSPCFDNAPIEKACFILHWV